MTTALRIGKGTLTTGSTDGASANIDTAAVPNGKVRFVKAVTLCNASTGNTPWINIEFAGTKVINGYVLEAPGGENTITIPFFDQIMTSGERITGAAEASGTIHFYISAREVAVS